MKKEYYYRAIGRMKECRDKLSTQGCCSWMVEFENSAFNYWYDEAPCFANLSGLNPRQTPIAIISRIMNSSHEMQSYPEDWETKRDGYFQWLFNHSPWASVFPIKNVAFANKLGSIIVDPTKPQNLVIGGLIASRLPHEYPSHLNNWIEFTALGMNPALALYFSTQIYPARDGIYGMRNECYGHHPFSGDRNDVPTALVLNDKDRWSKRSYVGYRSVNGTSVQWNSGDNRIEWYEWLVNIFQRLKIQNQSNNPFDKNSAEPLVEKTILFSTMAEESREMLRTIL